ncbi:MAG: transcription-repair coupling factor [Verrucomicrobiae bacterium]|nr:transcription-repair coupling factor [Verrucomicrobiae bacterium]
MEKGGVSFCAGVARSGWAFVAALLAYVFPKRVIVVVAADAPTQELVYDELRTWLSLAGERMWPAKPVHNESGALPAGDGAERLVFFPAWDVLPNEDRLPHADVISDRISTLVALTAWRGCGAAGAPVSDAPVLVTTGRALMQRTFAPAHFAANTLKVACGDRVNPLELREWLEARAYEPEARVTQKSEVALRGGILDCWPVARAWPVRLEFFGDEIESLREFDPVTQISRGRIESVVLTPGGELGLLKRALGRKSEAAHDPAQAQEPHSCFQSGSADTIAGTLLDYLPPEALVVLCEPDAIVTGAAEYARLVPPNDALHCNWDDVEAKLCSGELTVLAVTEAGKEELEPCSAHLRLGQAQAGAGLVDLQLQSLEAYRPLNERPPEPEVAEVQRREFFCQMQRWLRQGYRLEVFCAQDGEQQRFRELWAEYSTCLAGVEAAGAPTGLNVHLGGLSAGFLCDPAGLVVVTDAEIFGRYKLRRPRRLRQPQAPAVSSVLDIDFTELEEGDLVVHAQYGIGRYCGLKTLPVRAGQAASTGSVQPMGVECLVIEYAPSVPGGEPPKLYVPVTDAHLVSKYIGAGRARPPLSVLGSRRWLRAKAAAARAVRDVAAELLAVQAARESQPGYAFSPDTAWQREFESSFPYEETPDQLRAIRETKADMEKPKPMDRLICGDAGFGKTEVAIRAAFKAVMDGKQVAVLVPTTVLAHQHYNTFRERMAAWPVRIELLSRFRTRAQQRQIIRDLASGAVDIVIGTHRLLQDDVQFKDLGLVVIDEEQRFGVLHKEKLKMLRRLVDVLTLTATPIPRTLYLALCGARDMSLIQTPPQDRLPVETIVCQYDERVIRDAIQRELNRGGQVFFLHNRVATIESVAQKLRELVPHARVAVAHGQMPSDELEEVMTRFVNGEADVLLSTTIIESGLDIPNANTIIIDRADRFGLSDLYQLRGRVGRYKHQAYAYLLLPRHSQLLTDVRKRISAIKQYSTLGCGFKIAMRDLEIRGAGNLLGREQSGHITAVGFDLYCQLLKQAIAALKGQPEKPRPQVEVKLDFVVWGADACAPVPRRAGSRPAGAVTCAVIPQSYIPDPVQRIEIYRKLAQAPDATALNNLAAELRDRFGPVPPEVELLLQISELKILAAERGVTSVEVKDDKLMLGRRGEFVTVGGRFPRLKQRTPRARLNEIKQFVLALAPEAIG